MADDNRDDNEKEDGFDPWADLESDASADQAEQFSFTFDDAPLDGVLDDALDASVAKEPVQPSFAEEPVAAADMSDALDTSVASDLPDVPVLEPAADDALVNAWLDDPADEPSAQTPLAVFSPDEPGDVGGMGDDDDVSGFDPAAIEIGTGYSGIDSASEIEELGIVGGESGVGDEAAAVSFGAVGEPESPTDEIDESVSFGEPVAETSDQADIIDFGTAAAGVAAAAAASGGGESVTVAATKPRRGGKARKRGGITPLVGIVLGGLMAIPVVLGILIGLMWMGWRDTAGIRTWMPEQAAFLLPPANRGAVRAVAGGPDLTTAPSLDDLPTADSSAEPGAESGTEPGAEPAPETAVVSADEPAAPPMPQEPEELVTSAEPGSDASASDKSLADTEPVGSSPTGEPMPDDLAAIVPTEPSLDDVAAVVAREDVAVVEPVPMAVEPVVPAAPAVPAPEPLDMSGLERSVADASTALEALQRVADPADPARKTLLVEWYRQLARVAEELAMLERVAADSGRPLAATPEVAADLHDRILASPECLDDLARLARNWMNYSRREGDGMVMPATFAGTRQVGPYWYSQVSMAEAGGRVREIAVISRMKPAAAAGDAVLISGLTLDGDVLWASDIRSAAARAADSSTPEPATESDPFGLPDL